MHPIQCESTRSRNRICDTQTEFPVNARPLEARDPGPSPIPPTFAIPPSRDQGIIPFLVFIAVVAYLRVCRPARLRHLASSHILSRRVAPICWSFPSSRVEVLCCALQVLESPSSFPPPMCPGDGSTVSSRITSHSLMPSARAAPRARRRRRALHSRSCRRHRAGRRAACRRSFWRRGSLHAA